MEQRRDNRADDCKGGQWCRCPVSTPCHRGVVADWEAAGHHDPEQCEGACDLPADHRRHDPPSCGCGGTHWSCNEGEPA